MSADASLRWSLAQALGWMATQDVRFVETLAPSCDPPATETLLIVRVRIAGFPSPRASDDQELISRIAAGRISADGEPGETFETRMDRRPIGGSARGCRVYSGRSDDLVGFYLEPDGERQSRWYGVEVDAEALMREFPPSISAAVQPGELATAAPSPARNKVGRPEKYDWRAIEKHVIAQLGHHGLPTVEDPAWATQTDVVRSALSFCLNRYGSEPGHSTMKRKVREWMLAYQVAAHN